MEHHKDRTSKMSYVTGNPPSTSKYKLTCHHCGEGYDKLQDLSQHVYMFHGYAHVCPLCGKGFQSRSGLSKHKDMHRGRTFTCPICDKQFKQKKNVKSHMISVHGAILGAASQNW